MQTTLPELPFSTVGIEPLLPPSSTTFAAGASPRTNLKTIQPWTSFTTDIQTILHTHMAASNIPHGTRLTVGSKFMVPREVECEESVRGHANLDLHLAVQGVVRALGIQGRFKLPAALSGSVVLVGEPDFSWISGVSRVNWRPKLLVEYVTDWVAGLEDLPAFFAKPKNRRNRNQKQSMYALEQVYGYMVFNNCKYGVLSNWTRAWFLRHVDAPNETIECAGPVELCGSPGMPSMLKAFVGMVLLAERDATETLPTPRFLGSSETAQKRAITLAGNYDVAPVRGSYPLLPLDVCLCDFDLGNSPHLRLVRTRLSREGINQAPLEVMCKIADIIHTPDARIALQDEAKMYAALHHLQGDVIPKLHGYYELWGILHVLALEPVGEAVPEDGEITTALHDKMKSALAQIHAAGYIHGDIARRNFCERGDKIFIVDLERSRRCKGEWEKTKEMESMDYLLCD